MQRIRSWLSRRSPPRSLPPAVHAVMQHHGTAVFRYCRAAMDDADRAERIHRQIFLEAAHRSAEIPQATTVRAWLFAIARRQVLAAASSAPRAPHASEPTAPAAASAIGSLDDGQLLALLSAALRELSAELRTLLLLRYQQGLSLAELAEICDQEPSELSAQCATASRELQRAIEAVDSPGSALPRRGP